MKKTLVALAALAATSVFAQSSVTISGNIDLGMQTTKETGQTIRTALADADTGATVRKTTTGPIGNGASGFTSSALGLDIKEDLGNGATAGYSAAMNVTSWGAGADTASQALGTGRHSYVFLGSKNAGEVRLGYQYTLDDQIQGGVGRATPTGNIAGRMQNASINIDPNKTAATAPAAFREGYEVISTGAITRLNAIQYNTPVYSGFQGMIQYASQAADVGQSRNTTPDGKADGKVSGAALKYSNGPLNLGGSYMKVVGDSLTSGDAATKAFKSTQTLQDLAANYDLGSAKLFANYFKRSAKVAAGSYYDGTVAKLFANSAYGALVDGGSLDRNGYDIGVSAPVGAWTLYGSMGKATHTLNTDGTAGIDTKLKGYTLAAAYSFSKRTSLNVYTGMAKTTGESEFKKAQTGFGLNHNF